MINEIKKLLARGEVVELECVDKDGLAKLTPYVEGLISQELLTIESWCSDCLYLNINKRKCHQDTLNKEEIQYFRIKRPAPTFDDLINVAVKAAKDGLIIISAITDWQIQFVRGCDSRYIVSHDHNRIKEEIDFINSLYTETFVIKEFSDTEILKLGAKAVLGNGEELIFRDRIGDELWFEYNDCHNTKIPFIALKGATITQKKGY